MNTEVKALPEAPSAPSAGRRSQRPGEAVFATAPVLAVLALAWALCTPVLAQVPGAPTLGAPLPPGSGAGIHSPDSPFKPLPQRADVVPWSVLTAVTTRTVKNRILPTFRPEQLALNEKTQRIQGFMLPLEPGEKQRHFLLSSIPLTCGFCVPGGPESMVEVRTRAPMAYSLEPVTVEGRFAVLADDPHGLYYRITDAVGVK